MTFTYFVSLMVGQGLSLRSKVTISNLLDEEGIAQVDRFIKNIIAVTFGVEALGAIGLYFPGDMFRGWRETRSGGTPSSIPFPVSAMRDSACLRITWPHRA